jgi:hypothetical protein
MVRGGHCKAPARQLQVIGQVRPAPFIYKFLYLQVESGVPVGRGGVHVAVYEAEVVHDIAAAQYKYAVFAQRRQGPAEGVMAGARRGIISGEGFKRAAAEAATPAAGSGE